MAVDICAMQENLRWEGEPAKVHLTELLKFNDFNAYMSEYFDVPAPTANVLDAVATLMGWAGDSKQIVTQMTGQRHTEDKLSPEHIAKFVEALRRSAYDSLLEPQQTIFRERVTEDIAWKKFDQEQQRYIDRTPMNSYDVLKCSQACFHLFEWLRSLLPENERPPRFQESDIKAYRVKESELKSKGCWPEDPPPGPQERLY